MRPDLAAIALTLAATAPASATGTISCASAAGGVSVELAVGTVPGLAIVGGLVEAGGRRWGIDRDGATPIRVTQAFATADRILVDFAEEDANRPIGELRLFRANEGRDTAMAGTLHMADVGAWAVTCEGG